MYCFDIKDFVFLQGIEIINCSNFTVERQGVGMETILPLIHENWQRSEKNWSS